MRSKLACCLAGTAILFSQLNCVPVAKIPYPKGGYLKVGQIEVSSKPEPKNSPEVPTPARPDVSAAPVTPSSRPVSTVTQGAGNDSVFSTSASPAPTPNTEGTARLDPPGGKVPPEASKNSTEELSSPLTMLFAVGRYDLDWYPVSGEPSTPRPMFYCQEILHILQEHPSWGVEIVGHASEEGDDESNLTLSRHRAQVVQTFLLANGISKDRIHADWMGSSEPIDPGDTELARRLNRRVVATFSPL